MKVNFSEIGKKTGDRYSSYANKYTDLFWNDLTDNIFINKFLKLIKKNGLILDVGCGPGKEIQRLIKKGYQAVGIDTSKGMISIAKKKNPTAKFYQMDATNIEFPGDYFDGVISFYVLDHLPSPLVKKSFREIYKVLKNNSPFCLIQHEGNFEGEKIDLMSPNKTLFRNFKPIKWLRQGLIEAGFKIYYSRTRKFPDIEVGESSERQLIIIALK